MEDVFRGNLAAETSLQWLECTMTACNLVSISFQTYVQ